MSRVKSWGEAFSIYKNKRVIAMLFLGFSAGLPFLLVFSTLSAWLHDYAVTKTTIGFFSWIGLTYSIKVFWAPFVDHLKIPKLTNALGRRRSWMLIAQVAIALFLVLMGLSDPSKHLLYIALFGLGMAFSSATQDIAIDAYRIEAVVEDYQAAMAATYILGYRLALLFAGAGALFIADFSSWGMAYFSMAAAMAVGVITVLLIAEPESTQTSCRLEHGSMFGEGGFKLWLVKSFLDPFRDFASRYGKQTLWILCLIGLYKVSDITMGVMANPFYLDMGYSKSEIASIAKVFGFFMSIAGAIAGGLYSVRYGMHKMLLMGALLVASTNLLFAGLSLLEPNLSALAVVISADNISGGFASAVFIAYLSSLTSRDFTATQYALFSSLMTLPAKLIGGFSGIVVDTQGYFNFFVYASLLGLPAIFLLLYIYQYRFKDEQS